MYMYMYACRHVWSLRETDLCAKDPSRGNRVRARAPREKPLSTRVPLVRRVVVLILRLFDPLCPVPLLRRIFGDSVGEVGGLQDPWNVGRTWWILLEDSRGHSALMTMGPRDREERGDSRESGARSMRCEARGSSASGRLVAREIHCWLMGAANRGCSGARRHR